MWLLYPYWECTQIRAVVPWYAVNFKPVSFRIFHICRLRPLSFVLISPLQQPHGCCWSSLRSTDCRNYYLWTVIFQIYDKYYLWCQSDKGRCSIRDTEFLFAILQKVLMVKYLLARDFINWNNSVSGHRRVDLKCWVNLSLDSGDL